MDLRRIEAENYSTKMQLMRKICHEKSSHLNKKNQQTPHNIYEIGECSNSQFPKNMANNKKFSNVTPYVSDSTKSYQIGQNVLWLKPTIKKKRKICK